MSEEIMIREDASYLPVNRLSQFVGLNDWHYKWSKMLTNVLLNGNSGLKLACDRLLYAIYAYLSSRTCNPVYCQ